ncbi:Histidinol-phosphate aminotransferase [uncultured Desulfobacterium sp.]|uniref:Histidinol-phosphate aminotransferase n=1 Tax=uncultured Desulfobacterium sp. TaxID=201089 RepID=A0A445MW68_9BACT|nr:Histidinol-phosphate aminotransferase [uncultured Desulfobacterium sp.]
MKSLTHQGVEELIPYPPGKPIEELERELGIKNSIKLASNENPLGPSPMAVRAIMDRVHGLHRYPDGSGYYLKERLGREFGLPIEQIILGNGSNELIELIVRTCLTSGEHVVQAFPTFLVYEKVVKSAGAMMSSAPLSDFRIDLNAVYEKINPKTKIIFINNPNNPTGSVLKKDQLLGFLRRIPTDIVVVLDEAYIEFVTEEDVAQGLDLMKEYPLLFVLRTFSKLYGLAGLRIGYGFASERLIDYMNRVRQPFNANSLAQAGAIAALDDRQFVARTLKLVQEGLRFLYAGLDEMGLPFVRTQTNFFLIKVPHGGKEIYNRMLKQGVIIRSMDSYGLPEFIRINVGLPEENERFIRTLKKVL